jgi:acyl-CoA thioester hydrolase
MARVEIPLPDTFAFSTEIPVRIGDLNYGGHVGNGWTEGDVAGAGIIMADAAIVYRAEGFHGMVLKVEIAVAGLRSRSCDLLHRITDVASGAEIARVKTGIVFFDYATRKVVTVPGPFRAAFAAGS